MNGDARTVLVIEDDQATAELERRVLARAGMNSHVCRRVGDALAALEHRSFLAILLDYQLPSGDPWAVVALAQAKIPRIPVIMVTAMGDERVAAEALQRGVADYLRKAESFWDELPTAVERVARLATVQEELRRTHALFQLFADHASDLFVRAEHGVITYVSAACRGMLGYEPDELIGSPYDGLVHPDDRGATAMALSAASGADHVGTLVRARRKDGSYAWIESNVHVVRDPATGAPLELLAISRDVTERKRVDEALRQERARLEEAQQIGHVGNWEWDLARNEVTWSPELGRIHGLAPSSRVLDPEEAMSRIHPDDRDRVESLMRRAIADRASVSTDYRIVRPGGEVRAVNGRAGVFVDDGRVVRIVGTVHDITERKEMEEQLARHAEVLQTLSMMDELTGAYNRRGFNTVARPALKLAQRNRVACTLLFIDLDDLKAVNDQFGHAAGDQLIQDVAAVLKATVRDSDIVARLGGDELAVLVYDCGPDGTPALLARIRHEHGRHEASVSRSARLAFSIGIAHYDPDAPEPVEVLLARADQAMYVDKRRRRGGG